MSTVSPPTPGPTDGEKSETIDAGTYEVLRGRLGARARELAGRAEALNARRIETFGGQQTRLRHTDRVRTENNSIPRDLAQVGGVMLFGYNVFIGLKSETSVDDVFAVHRFNGETFEPATLPGLLDDPGFVRDFAELYRYYKQTRLLQLRRVESLLLAVFQTGARGDDLKVLRWRVGTDGSVSYLDNRGERDHVFPPQHDFEWIVTGREQHVLGRHPHVSIADEVFVEAVGGSLTIKVENNTEIGEGIFSEPVDEPLQSLADAEISYARVGPLILLRVLPYQETVYRFLVFNTRTRDVRRLDGIGQACRRLPDDQGIIFPGGYYLATGAAKTFDADTTDLEYERAIHSVNGEDVLYVFHARAAGRYLLLPYNVIRKEVATPIAGHGYSLFDDGTLVVFRTITDEPARVHPMQVWQTPYESDTFAAARPVGDGPLDRIGNADLVRGIADGLAVTRMVDEMSPSGPVFEAIIAACTRVADSYHWLADAELENLAEPLSEVRATAEQVLDEFESVQVLTTQAADAVTAAGSSAASLIGKARAENPTTTGGWIAQLGGLRQEQGRLAGLREMRYADLARIDAVDADLAGAVDDTARRAVEHLRRPDAFADYESTVDELVTSAGAIATVAEAEPVTARIAEQFDGLQAVTEVIGGLDIADATIRVGILERLGTVMGGLNRARATVEGRRQELSALEGRAEFAAEFALFGQAVSGALAAADTPERCDEHLTRLMAQIETLETRFGDFADFAEQLSAKRTEVYEAISGRKQALLDEQARRADRLNDSARRILDTVRRRAGALADADQVNTYFATDPMVAKLRSLTVDLRELGDTVRAEELDGQLKAARQDAGRALRDRQDLYDDGGRTIRLGRHSFAVNTSAIDLTLVPHDGELAFAITGTDYRGPVRDEAFLATREFWDQPLVSEDAQVYRGEHLAAAVFAADPAAAAAALTDGTLRDLVRRGAEARYDEGYERGVHDADATLILAALVRLHAGAGLLRYPPQVRAAAQLFWAFETTPSACAQWTLRAASLARVRAMFGSAGAAWDELCAELGPGGEYLAEELATAPEGFATSAGARTLLDRFHRELGGPQSATGRQYAADLRALEDDRPARQQLVHAWLSAFRAAKPDAGDASDVVEAVAVELTGSHSLRRVGLAHRDRDRAARRAPADQRGDVDRTAGRSPDPHPATPRGSDAGLPRLSEAADGAGRRRTGPAAPGRVQAAGDDRVRPQPPARRGVPAAHRRQPGPAARGHRRQQAHRPVRPADADLAARLRQDHADGVRGRSARRDPGEGQRARARARRDVARPGRGARRDLTAGGREDLVRPADGQQRAALPGRHPAHEPGAAAEVHLAVRRPAPDGGRLGRTDPHVRPAGQALRGVYGGKPVHRDRSPLPGARHAGQPGRRVEPGRRAGRTRGPVRAVLSGECPHLEHHPGPAGRPRPGRPAAAAASGRRRRHRTGGPVVPSLFGGRTRPGAVGAAQDEAGPAGGAAQQPGLHRVGGAVGRGPHRAAVPAAGLLPQHEQAGRAHRAGDERRRAGDGVRRPLPG